MVVSALLLVARDQVLAIKSKDGNLVLITGLKLRVRYRKIIFLFLIQNICCGYAKEPSQ